LPFITRETVACETPALTATSAMPILPVADLLTMGLPFVGPSGHSAARGLAMFPADGGVVRKSISESDFYGCRVR
jgi:ABC-type proline/glycine betaine transport system permease subunit